MFYYHSHIHIILILTFNNVNLKLFLLGKKRSVLTVGYNKDVNRMYKTSIINKEGKLLVLFLYASNEELRMVRMHPELCVADTTFGTNNEKKELFTLAFKDGNNKAFNGGRCFIPNAQKWVFAMLFKHCLPIFWDSSVCNNMKLMLTDGCTSEYLPFILNIGFNNAFPKAVHGLCYYHLAIQGFKKYVDPHVPTVGRFSKRAKVAVYHIKKWVKDWFFDVEDEAEYRDSRSRFNTWVHSQKGMFLITS